MNNQIPINTNNSPTVILELIYKLKVRDVMQKKIIGASKHSTLREIQKLMKENLITGVPIVDNKRLFGIVSMNDIIQALDETYIDDPAEKHMSKKITILEEAMPLSVAITYFDKYKFRRFPVLNQNRELVGMITSRDITMRLLIEINKEIQKIEQNIKIPKVVMDTDGIYKQYTLQKYDFENAGKASNEIKRLLKEKGVNNKIIRRIAVACYELEMNQVNHSHGGKIIFMVDKGKAEISAIDTGPGIENIDDALTEGFSTANEWIRSLGFGAGLGLPNVKRVSDQFYIVSKKGDGTAARSIIYLESSPFYKDANKESK